MEARRRLLLVERTCLIIGLVGLAGWGVFHIRSVTSTRQSLERFATLRSIALPAGTPDQSLWSPHRVSAWEKALSDPAPVPLAVLRIPKIRLEAPVLPGTDDSTLDRAVGHIEGTANPGTEGNSGIAGHRDGFFRGLKDIVQGDVIELDTIQGNDSYRVERTWVVDPEDVSVLDPTSTRALTLVTCYPFYYVGSAPRRFIVRAVLAGNRLASVNARADRNGEVYVTFNDRSGHGRGGGLVDRRRVAGADDDIVGNEELRSARGGRQSTGRQAAGRDEGADGSR